MVYVTDSIESILRPLVPSVTTTIVIDVSLKPITSSMLLNIAAWKEAVDTSAKVTPSKSCERKKDRQTNRRTEREERREIRLSRRLGRMCVRSRAMGGGVSALGNSRSGRHERLREEYARDMQKGREGSVALRY
jgi:hypothetical protein